MGQLMAALSINMDAVVVQTRDMYRVMCSDAVKCQSVTFSSDAITILTSHRPPLTAMICSVTSAQALQRHNSNAVQSIHRARPTS